MVGQPFFPYFMAKGGAWFFFIFAALAFLATFAQINPVWLYGPYTPVAISSASQPDFYMGILEGSLRMMPAWEYSRLGHTLSLGVLIPFALPLTIILGGATFWPFFEQWATGDKSWHNINDRPRNAPVRTGVGMAAVVFYGVLWPEGANDVIADKLQIPLYTVTWIARVLIFVGPAVAYIVTRRICLGLQRKDKELLEHGLETGIIRQMPDGEFIEVHRPVRGIPGRARGEEGARACLPQGRRTRTACQRLPPAAAWAGRRGSPTVPSRRPSWPGTGTGMVTDLTVTGRMGTRWLP